MRADPHPFSRFRTLPWARCAMALLTPAVLTACPTAHTLQTARALGTGRTQVSAELGAQVHPLQRFTVAQPLGGNEQPFETFGTADLTLRYGLGPRTDGFGRFGSSGVEAGLKQELIRAQWFSLGALGSVRSRFDWVTESFGQVGGDNLQQMLDGTAAVLFELRAGIVSVVLAPKAVGSLHSGLAPGECGQRTCNAENVFPYFDYGATLGVQLRFGSFVLMPEVAALSPLRERSWVDADRPAMTGTVSFGWVVDASRDGL